MFLSSDFSTRRSIVPRGVAFIAVAAISTACTHPTPATGGGAMQSGGLTVVAPSPDPRVGLKAGLWDAGQAQWNIRLVSNTKPSERFAGATNSDMAFIGPYAIQGSYNGYQVWDITDPAAGTQGRDLLSGFAERRVGLQEPAVRVGRGNRPAASTAATRGEGHGEQGAHPRYPDLRHHGHRRIRKYTWSTCRRAVDRTRTRCWSIPRTRTTSTSTFPARRRRARAASCGLHSDSGRSEYRPVPYRSHQSAVRASGAGRDRQLAPHLQ